MKVLITNTGPWGTGSGTVADGVMIELINKGHTVKAFFPDSGLPGADIEKYYGNKDLYYIVKFPHTYNGVELYTFPLIIKDPNPRNYSNAWTFKDMTEKELNAYISYLKDELKKVIDDFKPDIVECQHIWVMDHILNELGYPYICVAHHSDQLGFLYDERMSKIAIKSAQNAEAIFAISEYVKEEVLDFYKVDPSKVHVVTNGYDQKTFKNFEIARDDTLKKFNISSEGNLPVVTFCGKVSATKGIDILLQANHIIQKNTKVILAILGSGDLDTFDAETKNTFCMENVYMLGQRSSEELAQIHNISKLSVLPSRSEGFGIAALEAMGCGLPMVATNVGGLSSFIVGKLVDKEDPEQLGTLENSLGILL